MKIRANILLGIISIILSIIAKHLPFHKVKLLIGDILRKVNIVLLVKQNLAKFLAISHHMIFMTFYRVNNLLHDFTHYSQGKSKFNIVTKF